MATYNGASYIREQIESIQAQTVSHWRLLVRDDGSTDGTSDILVQFASDDFRISLLESRGGTALGPSLNFGAALESALETDSNLFFISDQDDVWHPEKLSIQTTHFPEGGAEAVPALVHSDLAVVDEGLNSIHGSLIDYMGLLPSPEAPLNYLLTRNFVTGCATACNRKLLEQALPVADDAIMHDWWLALAAAASGKIEYLDMPLVKYRQHDANSQGAKGFWHGLNPTNNWIAGWKAGNAEYQATFNQVAALASHARQRSAWPRSSIALMEQFLELRRLPFRKRLRTARSLGLRQGNGLLQVIFYIRLLTVHDKRPPCPP
jgi:glycosyltransferase involved in cell wall biosynthesis